MNGGGKDQRWALLAAALWLAAAPATAVTDLARVGGVADISIDLDGTLAGPQRVVLDDAQGGVTVLDLGDLAARRAHTAYAQTTDGAELVAFDIPIALDAFTMRPADAAIAAATRSRSFDGAANGIPAGIGVDAVIEIDGDLVPRSPPPSRSPTRARRVEDEDLVRRAGDSFTLLFDGSAAGLPDGLDLDGAQVLANGHLLLSFDGSGQIEDVAFDDEDVLELDPLQTTWQLAYDASAAFPQWRDADLTALLAVVVPDTPTATETAVATATRTPTRTAGASAYAADRRRRVAIHADAVRQRDRRAHRRWHDADPDRDADAAGWRLRR